MNFISVEFTLFFTVVFYLYWTVFRRNARIQNLFLLFASVIFYCLADWRFTALLLFSALFNFKCGQLIYAGSSESRKKLWLWTGVIVNIGILGYFKYFDFFYNSFSCLLDINHRSFNILIPLGISFFTFQVIGYLIDVYNEEMEACSDALIFTTYVTYFPKISAGPIENAQNFFPQIRAKRVFNMQFAVDGLRQILWGLFAKIVIADNCAASIKPIFENPEAYAGSTLVVGAFLYAFQVYCDFASYSNMAIGISKLLGISLTQNFRTPFFSLNISDYWKKWHISLSNWMMNYLFTPLSFAFRNYGKLGLILATVITFVVVGLWHGANWTFIVFGLLHGIYFIPLIIKNTFNSSFIVAQGKILPSLTELLKMLKLFLLVMLTMIVFRSDSVGLAITYYSGIIDRSLFSVPEVRPSTLLGFIVIFIVVEWLGREKEFAIQNLGLRWPRFVRVAFYYCIIICVFYFGGKGQQFIYFQF
jgi:alginate O-acetyltransferase complex protein AlgI